jgi:hypothetical protein
VLFLIVYLSENGIYWIDSIIFEIIISYLTQTDSILFKIKPSDIRMVHEINSGKNVNEKWNGRFVSTSQLIY